MKSSRFTALLATLSLVAVAAYSQASGSDEVVGFEATMSYESNEHERYSLEAGRFAWIEGPKGTLRLYSVTNRNRGKAPVLHFSFVSEGLFTKYMVDDSTYNSAGVSDRPDATQHISPMARLVFLDQLPPEFEPREVLTFGANIAEIVSDTTELNDGVYERTIQTIELNEDQQLATPELIRDKYILTHEYTITWSNADRSDRTVVTKRLSGSVEPLTFTNFRSPSQDLIDLYHSSGIPIGHQVTDMSHVNPVYYNWQGQVESPPFRYWVVVIGAVIAAVIAGLVVLRQRNPARARKDDPFAPIR